MAKVGRSTLTAAVVASAAGLVLAVVYVSSSGAPGTLLQKMSPESNFQVASQRVAVAQAKVARDLAALRRTEAEAGVKGSSKLQGDFGVAAHYGPQTKDGQLEFDRFHRPGSGGPYANELEDPDHEWSRTPRSKAREGDPYFQYGPNARYCPGGNCEPLEEKAGPDMAAERWPHDMYRSIPWMGFDPDASPARNRAINERTGEFADELHTHTYHPPVKWGVGGLEGSGTMAAEDRGVVNLEAANVAQDKWPWDIYRSIPYPGFDRTEFDQDLHEDRYPHMDPLELARETQESKMALQDAGVDVDRAPTDTNFRTYNQVDGINDKLVPVEDAPSWRKGGVAAQEEPASFLLHDHPDMSGPQPTQDAELGYEIPPKKAAHNEQAYWGFWDSIGCGENGCFGKRMGEE